ncbi:alpha-mannosidase [Quadrisphaera setariae]|uniref:Alpha-mannosidase n=1 Tax=Quadrisphaera setariae TaxID=2593304 RepID=A0A5C8ZDY8_9ACTN|nr:glycoside hydrolase family 38 C-terminal domain-containing protein [Quadrisphaera setariae]TXR55509.1 alpha-mannosidase [Quadrisphaera setariae]
MSPAPQPHAASVEDLLARTDRWLAERLLPAVVQARLPVGEQLALTAWEVPGADGLTGEPVPFAVARAAHEAGEGAPAEPGQAWGPPWSTTWFRLEGVVPPQWSALLSAPQEDQDDDDDGGRPSGALPRRVLPRGVLHLEADLGFTSGQPGFDAEGLVHTDAGAVVDSLHPRSRRVRLAAAPGERVVLHVEAASNPDLSGGGGRSPLRFTPTPLGRRQSAGARPLRRLGEVALVVTSPLVEELVADVVVVRQLAEQLPADSPRRRELLDALVAAQSAVDPFSAAGVASTAAAGRAALAGVLAGPAAASAHRVSAVGHAHIDLAWLWPVRETRRKIARTTAHVLALMDSEPDLVFACSSAQQLEWVRTDHPELFERIRERVAQGRFVPVGGMWVESDTNLPTGESLVRQLLEGSRWFAEHLGASSDVLWLPDSFGYSAALPQVAVGAGMRAFATQKLAWNDTNPMPHHHLAWEGLDGSRLYAHLMPVDTYNSDLSARELAKASRQAAATAGAPGGAGAAGNRSLVPFGYGDGGGGPTREALRAARRLADLDGSPTVSLEPPSAFVDAALEAFGGLDALPVWAGELYLEFHRGTYTAQSRTKRGNRRCERLLHEAELWSATAAVRAGRPYPLERLREAWRTVLLNQFHDILPGSSIGWVHDQAEAEHARVAADLEALIAEALTALGGDATGALANPTPHAWRGVPAHGTGVPEPLPRPVAVTQDDDETVLDNGVLRAVVDDRGLVVSLRALTGPFAGREVVPPGGVLGLLQLFRDTPAQYDAWDLDAADLAHPVDVTGVDALRVEDGRAVVVERTLPASAAAQQPSRVVQTFALLPGADRLDITTAVDWHHGQHLLKLALDVDVHTTTAASEVQFGHVTRPVHRNTSWDVARFEAVAHRWVHVADASLGVALLQADSYGHDVQRLPRAGRARRGDGAQRGTGTSVRVRQSLLRAPSYPDPAADRGQHVLRSAVLVGSIADAVREGYRTTRPLRPVPNGPGGAGGAVEPLVASSEPAVVVETVKLAADGSGDVVVRLSERHGGAATTRLTASFEHGEALLTDLLERSGDQHLSPAASEGGRTYEVALGAFQVLTVRFTRSGGRPRRARGG